MVLTSPSRKQVALGSLIAASVIAVLSTVYFVAVPVNTATANAGLAATDKYADIAKFKAYRIGNGALAEQVTDRFKTLGLDASNLYSTLPEKGDQNTLVIFSDSDSIKGAQAAGKIGQLLYSDYAKVIMVSDNMDDIRAFVSVAGNVNPDGAQVIGYKVRPPDTMCNIDGQVTECGGTGSALVITAVDKDHKIDVGGIQQAILAWMSAD